MSTVPPSTPVLVGIGVVSQREEDYTRALEPIDLMLAAVRAAGEDCGAPALLGELDRIAIPRGRWRYRNPSGEIARVVGAARSQTIVSSVGVLQQTLIADACAAIAGGQIESALITGADAGYRLLRAKIVGDRASERAQDDDPDVLLEPKAELRHPAELAAGLTMPVGLYALLESARRAAAGLDLEAHRDRLARRYEQFAAIAAQNPDAWNRSAPAMAAIRDAGPGNPMQAFPYTRSHCSTWNVDQAAALLLCSAGRAEALGIPRSRWVFPAASAEANHMLPVSARAELVRCAGADVAAAAVLEASGIAPDAIDLVDLYSCFPVAVEAFAEAAGLDPDGAHTITGGMPFAGGPYNNYFFQATARAGQLLRSGAGRHALLSCVSGIMTKQAFALWSSEPPAEGFQRRDVTDAAAAAARELPVEEAYTGAGRVAGCTVLHGRGQAPRAVLLVDTAKGTRALATSEAEDVIAAIESEEWVGRQVEIMAGELAA